MDKVDFVQKTQMIVDSGLGAQVNLRIGFPVSRFLGPESCRFVEFVGSLPMVTCFRELKFIEILQGASASFEMDYGTAPTVAACPVFEADFKTQFWHLSMICLMDQGESHCQLFDP